MNLNSMFGKIEPGMCRITMDGAIAVKTKNGYKSYNMKTSRLTNCSNFVFDIGQEFFFLIPTNKVEPGDIILANGKPKCVIAVDKNMITAINYEDAVVENILPERHVFFGNTYFYGKIVSMFGSDIFKGKSGMKKMMSYMMMSQMMSGDSLSRNGTSNNLSAMLPMMMMGGFTGNIFDGLFDDEESIEEKDEEKE